MKDSYQTRLSPGLRAGLERHESGDWAGAQAFYRAGVDGEAAAFAWHLLGVLAFQTGDAEAETLLRAAIALDDGVAEFWSDLAEMLRGEGRVSAALDAVKQALVLDPELAAAHNNHGLLSQRLGRLEAAKQSFERAARLDTQAADPHNNLGNVALASGDFEGARAAYRRCVALDPNCAAAWRHLTLVTTYKDPEDPEIARLEALAARASPAQRSHLHFALGKAYDDLSATDRAFEHYVQGNKLLRGATDWDALKSRWNARLKVPLATGSPGSESELPVLIVGPPRSGTTLIEQILARHSSVGTVGESDALPECLAQWPADDRPTATQRTAWAESYLDSLRHGAPGKLRVVDKNPYNLEHLSQLAWLVPRSRVILMDRDLRAVGLSIFQQRFARPTAWAYDLEDIGRWLALRQGFTGALFQKAPLRVFVLSYQQLVDNPEAVCQRLFHWLQLPWEPEVLEAGRIGAHSHTASAWQARQPIHKGSLHKWQRYAAHLGPLIQGLRAPNA